MKGAFDHIEDFYFVGVGGIGMSALARWFKRQGKHVSGYDRTQTPLTRKLVSEGIDIHYEDSPERVPTVYQSLSETSLVVYTPAIPKGHKEIAFLRQIGYTPLKRSEVLGKLSESYFTIAVGGTHGKTSTSAILAHLLHEAGVPMLAFVGGVLQGYESNLICNTNAPEVLVIEADEYDRSFLRLDPDIAIITAIEADHLDIYGEYDGLRESFIEFGNKAKSALLVADGVDLVGLDDPRVTPFRYGYEAGDAQAEDVVVSNGSVSFTYRFNDVARIQGFTLKMPGKHNIVNAVGAILAAQVFNGKLKLKGEMLKSFGGVKRRFEYVYEDESVVYLDDYAHHPTEIRAFIEGARQMHPGRKLTVCFQPHLFSRTRDFANGFAESLDLADEVVLLDIYPAREEPMPGVTTQIVFDKMKLQNKRLVSDEDFLPTLQSLELDVLATVGAGNIDRFVPQIADWLARRAGERRTQDSNTQND